MFFLKSTIFAHLECDFEFVEVRAEAVGVVGGAALSAGNGKEFFSCFGAAPALSADLHDFGELAVLRGFVIGHT